MGFVTAVVQQDHELETTSNNLNHALVQRLIKVKQKYLLADQHVVFVINLQVVSRFVTFSRNKSPDPTLGVRQNFFENDRFQRRTVSGLEWNITCNEKAAAFVFHKIVDILNI